MCTILTFDGKFFDENREELLGQLEHDFMFNRHGSTMIGVDPVGGDSELLSKNSSLAKEVTDFLDRVPMGRVFLHYRYATTARVGLAHNHVIPSFDGQFYLHNGVISNKFRYTVDSFNLVHLSRRSEELLLDLTEQGETFANVFIVDPEEGYGVVRLKTGTLFTDGQGNYSTHCIGSICLPVPEFSASEHDYFESYSIWERDIV